MWSRSSLSSKAYSISNSFRPMSITSATCLRICTGPMSVWSVWFLLCCRYLPRCIRPGGRRRYNPRKRSGMNSEVIIECQGLGKTFTEIGAPIEVLKSIDLKLRAGQQLAVVGASGSGKSTLLHLLGGLDRPTTGSVLIGGKDIVGLSDTECGRVRNQMLGFVYQFHH